MMMMDADDKKLILIVDDVAANLKIAYEILKPLYKLRIATSGAMALEAVKATRQPDLILLDVMMPEMDGYEVCTFLKADLSTREIPVIFLTALSDPQDESRGFAVGAVDYIHKPFSPAVVLARVKTHLKLREGREQLIETVLRSLTPAVETATAVGGGEVIPLITHLRSLLELKDPEAMNAIQALNDALAGEVDDTLLASLRKSIKDFDFCSALTNLSEIAKRCNLRQD